MKTLITILLFLPLCLFAKTGSFNTNNSLAFIENKGQIVDQYQQHRKDIDFKLNAPGMDIFIGNGQVHYQWSKVENNEQLTVNSSQLLNHGSEIANQQIETYRLDVTLLNANKNAQPITEEQQEYYENYYLPQYTDGITAHSFQKIICKNIYPNIDWVLYTSASGLKYDFIVHSGGNPKDIRIKYDGATSLSMNEGNFIVTTPFGSITENAPYTYEAETKRKIASSFSLIDDILSFDLAPYTGELIIDPKLEWASYYGGNADESNGSLGTGANLFIGPGVCADKQNNIYLAGNTRSSVLIATAGAFQNVLPSTTCGYLAKFNSQGSRVWATYYGAALGSTYISTVKCDQNDDLFIAGYTDCIAGIATPGSFKDTLQKHTDGVIAKFDNTGTRLWASYYGGGENEFINSMSIDANNDIYIAGTTSSPYGIASPGAFQDTFHSASNFLSTVFLAKFNTSGSRLWGTYYGDSANSYGLKSSVACDNNGFIYLAGICNKNTLRIASPGSHQDTGSASDEGFLAKFNSSGVRQWGTFYGGNGVDQIYDITCDKTGNVYVAGATTSDSMIATPGSFQSKRDSVKDGFFVKFNSSGVRQWSSYYGGKRDDVINGIIIDRRNDICVIGTSMSKNNMLTAGAWRDTNFGGPNAIFAKFSNDGQRLWSTYYGDANTGFATISTDTNDNYLIAGQTNSPTNIATDNAYQTVNIGGTYDHVILKALNDSSIYLKCDSTICRPAGSMSETIIIKYAPARAFNSGNIFTAQLSDAAGNFSSPYILGTVTSKAAGQIIGTIPSSVPAGPGYRIRIVASSPYYTSADNGQNIWIGNIPAKPTATGDTAVCEGGIIHLHGTSSDPNASFIWTGPNYIYSSSADTTINPVFISSAGKYALTVRPLGCKISDTLSVKVGRPVGKPEIEVNSPLCEGDTLYLNFSKDTGKVVCNWLWPNPTPIYIDTTHLIDIATMNMNGLFVVSVYRTGCTNADTADIAVKPTPVVTLSSNSPVKRGDDLNLYSSSGFDNISYKWSGPAGFSSAEQNPVIRSADSINKGLYKLHTTRDGCADSASITVAVQESVFALFPNPTKGSFRIRAFMKTDQRVPMEVVNGLGQVIWQATAETKKMVLDEEIVLPGLAAGVYRLHLATNEDKVVIPFVVK